MSHTEGKLDVKGNTISFENGGIVCYVDTGNYYADRDIATRIVATWNACQGMTEELLEKLLEMGGEPVFELGVFGDVMEQERDEAIDALSLALEWIESAPEGIKSKARGFDRDYVRNHIKEILDKHKELPSDE